MRAAPVLSLLLLASAFAGCLGGDDGDDPPATTTTPTTTTPVAGTPATPGEEEPTPTTTTPASPTPNATSPPPTTTTPPASPTPNATTPTPPAPVALAAKITGAYPATAKFEPAKLAAPAGASVTLTFTNEDASPLTPHNWALRGVDGAKTADVTSGQSADVTFTAPAAGDHEYYCTLHPNLKGTLTTS